MPFVKISDPNIIDLAAWHQVVNVVNQHTDSINAITNNFGVQASGQVDWNSDNNVVHEYNPGTEKILYGRFLVNTTDNTDNIENEQIFYGEISFIEDGATAYAARPIVNATLQFGHQDISLLDDKNHNLVLHIFGVTSEGFKYRVSRAVLNSNPSNKINGSFYISWQATGPK